MADSNQLNTQPNTGPTKRNRTSGRTDIDITPEEHIDWMTELGQDVKNLRHELRRDEALLRRDIKNLRQELGDTNRKLCTLERNQRQINMSHSQSFHSISHLTINTHSQHQDLGGKLQDLGRKIQDLSRKVQEFRQTQRQYQANSLQDPSTSGVENAGNTRIKSDFQNSKPDVRLEADSSELKSSKTDKEQGE